MKALPAGSGLLLLALLSSLLWTHGREALRREGLPAFFVAAPPGNLMRLEGDFPAAGLHQYSDGDTLQSVIKMAVPGDWRFHLEPAPGAGLLHPGQTLTARRDGEKNLAVSIGWMPARQRLALGIRLHPDRMTLADWPALPGIGPKLAVGIERDRQENGDFGSLEGLERVRGIGPKRIAAWRPWFE